MSGPECLQRIFVSFVLWGGGIPLCDPTIWIRRAHGGRHSDGAERHVARSVKQEFAKWSASIRDLLAGRTSSSTNESPHEARPNGARRITARIGGIFHSDRCMARLGVLSKAPMHLYLFIYWLFGILQPLGYRQVQIPPSPQILGSFFTHLGLLRTAHIARSRSRRDRSTRYIGPFPRKPGRGTRSAARTWLMTAAVKRAQSVNAETAGKA